MTRQKRQRQDISTETGNGEVAEETTQVLVATPSTKQRKLSNNDQGGNSAPQSNEVVDDTQDTATEPTAQHAATEPTAQHAATEPTAQHAATEPTTQHAATEPTVPPCDRPATSDKTHAAATTTTAEASTNHNATGNAKPSVVTTTSTNAAPTTEGPKTTGTNAFAEFAMKNTSSSFFSTPAAGPLPAAGGLLFANKAASIFDSMTSSVDQVAKVAARLAEEDREGNDLNSDEDDDIITGATSGATHTTSGHKLEFPGESGDAELFAAHHVVLLKFTDQLPPPDNPTASFSGAATEGDATNNITAATFVTQNGDEGTDSSCDAAEADTAADGNTATTTPTATTAAATTTATTAAATTTTATAAAATTTTTATTTTATSSSGNTAAASNRTNDDSAAPHVPQTSKTECSAAVPGEGAPRPVKRFRRVGEGLMRVLAVKDSNGKPCVERSKRRIVFRQKGIWALLLNSPLNASPRFDAVDDNATSVGYSVKFVAASMPSATTGTDTTAPPQKFEVHCVKFSSDHQRQEFLKVVTAPKT